VSLLLLLKPRASAVVTPAPSADLPFSTTNTARHKQIQPPRLHRFRAGTARILVRACQPALLLVPTAQGGTVRLSAAGADWEMRLESEAKKEPLTYRAARDERDLDELVEAAYLLTR